MHVNSEQRIAIGIFFCFLPRKGCLEGKMKLAVWEENGQLCTLLNMPSSGTENKTYVSAFGWIFFCRCCSKSICPKLSFTPTFSCSLCNPDIGAHNWLSTALKDMFCNDIIDELRPKSISDIIQKCELILGMWRRKVDSEAPCVHVFREGERMLWIFQDMFWVAAISSSNKSWLFQETLGWFWSLFDALKLGVLNNISSSWLIV